LNSGSRRTLFVALFCILLAVLPGALFAETTEILATGPDAKKGIPYLSPNVVPYFAVTYRTAHQESTASRAAAAPAEAAGNSAAASRSGGAAPAAPQSENDIRVLYTETEVAIYSSWKPAPCGSLGMLEVEQEPRVLFFQDRAGRSLFFVFPSSYPSPCAFVTTFINRFNYFLGVTQNSALSSFPAVLQIP